MKSTNLFLIFLISFLLNGCDNDQSASPVIGIVSPNENEIFFVGNNITIQVKANDPDGIIERVIIEVNDQQISEFDFEPYSFVWSTNGYFPGDYIVKATAFDNDGKSSSTSIQITLDSENPQISTLPISFAGTTHIQSGIEIESNGRPSIVQSGLCWNQTGSPTIDDHIVPRSNDGNPMIITGLEVNTEYHIRAFADNGITVVYGETLMTRTLNTHVSGVGSIVDSRDGTTYNWVQIGNQKWFAQNLVYGGGVIQTPYGPLYAGADCPKGWHVPNRDEWEVLIEHLGGEQVAGGVLKESGTNNWISPNVGASDTAGFTALPTGYANDGIGPPNYIGLNNSTMFLVRNEPAGRRVHLSTQSEGVSFAFGGNSSLLAACRCVED